MIFLLVVAAGFTGYMFMGSKMQKSNVPSARKPADVPQAKPKQQQRNPLVFPAAQDYSQSVNDGIISLTYQAAVKIATLRSFYLAKLSSRGYDLVSDSFQEGDRIMYMVFSQSGKGMVSPKAQAAAS